MRIAYGIAVALLFWSGPGVRAADWTIRLDPARRGGRLDPALLGHYDLSGALFRYDQVPKLAEALRPAGLTEWRVSAGRWEFGTRLLPALTNGDSCAEDLRGFPAEAFAPQGQADADLVRERDWFVDDGQEAGLADTQEDARYALQYVRRVADTASALGARPYISLDHMPRALAVNREFERSRTTVDNACSSSFTNRVSNTRPASPAVYAAAVEGLVRRVVLGSGGEAPRPVTHWEVGNEPEFRHFWDRSFDPDLSKYFEMAVAVLIRLDSWRRTETNPRAANQRFGLGSFANAELAAQAIRLFDDIEARGGPHVPVDFISFHSYGNDPMDILADIERVAAARAGSPFHRAVALILAEWGPDLTGAGWSAETMDVPLLTSTVVALGAAAGLERAHRAFFWDYYGGNVIRFGLLDHQLQPRPVFHAYAFMARVIGTGAERLVPEGAEDGRLANDGAVLAAESGGTIRVLLVNRGAQSRSVRIERSGRTATPASILVFDQPLGAPRSLVPAAEFGIPPRSLCLVELPRAKGRAVRK